MFSNRTIGNGGPYDGIVTLKSGVPFQFTRPVSNYDIDAQRVTEHEMDEVLGFGSFIGTNPSYLLPQDLFSWSYAGVRNITSSGSRYFSVDPIADSRTARGAQISHPGDGRAFCGGVTWSW
jgi:hypothetical protein